MIAMRTAFNPAREIAAQDVGGARSAIHFLRDCF
jgi:hypothetical protein